MIGNLVIIRVFGGDLDVRQIWAVGQNVVYVTDEKNYDLLRSGKGGISPVGVPKEDVFEYDEGIRGGQIDAVDLKRWGN